MGKIWQENLNNLIQFKSDNGHLCVSKLSSNKTLVNLVTTLRRQKRNGTLKPEREHALHQIGFDFDPIQSQWDKSYSQAMEFYKRYGHASPNRLSEDKNERTVAVWIHRMHKMVRCNYLNSELVYKLKLINIDGYPSKNKLTIKGIPEVFEKMLNRLNEYIDKHGSTIHSDMEDPVLYQWVMLQVQRIKCSVITPIEYSVLMQTSFKFQNESKNLMNIRTNELKHY